MSWRGGTPHHLPEAKGPYVPGCYDVMLGYSISGLFFRMYYPTEQKPSDKPNYQKWVKWFMYPETIDGYGKILLMWPVLLRIYFWWISADSTLIPVLYGEKPKTDNKLKCIICSHGYAAHRAFHSMIFNELASRGFLVIAIEHRDQSASFTHYYECEEDVKNGRRTAVEIVRIGLGERNFERRYNQVMHRKDESEKLLDFILELSKGNVPDNVLDHSENHQNIDVNLKDFVGKIDLDNIIMLGHSFGGATTLLTLAQRKEIRLGILLDPWMFPVKDEKDLHEKIHVPLIFINTKTFHVKANVRAMAKYLNRPNTDMYTIQHTTHESQTDSAFLLGYWLNWFMKKIDPVRAVRINNALILRFLKKHIDFTVDIEDCEELLKEEADLVLEGLTQPWG